ncbi:MAG: ABC-type transport auxiliary lipoprotein family protein [Lysobacteraceae bacterium]
MNRHLSARSVAGIRLAALLLAAAWLAGCGILPKQETLALYRPEPTIAVDAAWPQANWQLQIARPYADTMHDSARILVRPQPGELQVYKGAAWTQPAPDLVLDTLLRAFADSGRFAGISRRGEGVSAQYELLLDLRRFESDYDGGAAPGVRIEIGARLVHNAGNRVVASRVFDVKMPADGTDVVQVNRAFERALGDTTTQLIGWTLSEGSQDSTRKN